MAFVFRLTDWLHKYPSFFKLGLPLFLNWESLVLDWDSWSFTRWVPGLTITICNKITDTDDGCYPDLDLSTSDCLFHAKKLCQPIRSTSQIMVVTPHKYGVSVFVPQTLLRQDSNQWWRCKMSGTPNVNFRKISLRKTIWDLEFSEHLL